MTWEALRNACLACTQCPLCQTRHNVVFGVGPEDAEVLFIGEGPGEQEDLKGEPFVGPAGRLLDEMLTIIDLSRETCYIANIVKCRPPHNRDPLQVEQEACIGWLRAQTKLLQPKIIVCLGRIAAMKLIREDFKISREHGQWTQLFSINLASSYSSCAKAFTNLIPPKLSSALAVISPLFILLSLKAAFIFLFTYTVCRVLVINKSAIRIPR